VIQTAQPVIAIAVEMGSRPPLGNMTAG